MTAKRRLLAVCLAAAALAGCSSRIGAPPPPSPEVAGDSALRFFVRNETDRVVLVYVDGIEVLRVESGQRLRDELVVLPSRPFYRVEARTATGHVFGSFTSNEPAIGPGHIGDPETRVPGFVKNTRCGDIWVWLDRDIAMEIAPLRPEDQEPCD